jgi:hypothetical protein
LGIYALPYKDIGESEEKMRMKWFVAVLLVIMLLFIGGGVTAQAHTRPPEAKVWICHATYSEEHPYTKLQVDEDGWNGHDDHAHDFLIESTGTCPTTPPMVTICHDDVTYIIPWFDETDHKYNGHTDGACPIPPVLGCTDIIALNFNVLATQDDGSCIYPPEPIYGCMDETALNYNSEATESDGSCIYPPEIVYGCTDDEALNYNPLATVDDQSCIYEEIPPIEPPIVCSYTDTGRQVNEFVMNNTDPLHYGYFIPYAVKIGICKIEGPTGQYISEDHIMRSCSCQMPEDFVWRTDKRIVWHIVKDCHGNLFLRNDEGHIGIPYGGWEFGKYCDIPGCR